MVRKVNKGNRIYEEACEQVNKLVAQKTEIIEKLDKWTKIKKAAEDFSGKPEPKKKIDPKKTEEKRNADNILSGM